MDLMRRLLRLREGFCVVFENVAVVVDDWVWFRKKVKPRILERGAGVVEVGLSVLVSGDNCDDSAGINE